MLASQGESELADFGLGNSRASLLSQGIAARAALSSMPLGSQMSVYSNTWKLMSDLPALKGVKFCHSISRR
jgi:hypothetical protein